MKEFIDPIVRIRRSVRPVYPDWVETVMHPELENTGPVEYVATTLDQWLSPRQKSQVVAGNEIYQDLTDNNLLSTCAGWHDLIGIQKKGIAFFRANFKNKSVFGWRSVVRFRGGSLRVPCLYENLYGNGDEVVLGWDRLDKYWSANDPALRFTM